jgi:hypothetical protein
MVRPRKRKDDYGRRRHHGRVNFWDLGMVSTGAGTAQFTELDYGPIVPTFASQTSYGNPTSHSSAYPNLAEHDYDGLLSKIFEQPLSSWKTYYKKITPAMDYDLRVAKWDTGLTGASATEILSSDNPNFTNGGLKVPSDFFDPGYVMRIADFFAGTEVATQPFFLGDVPENKITTEFDIEAPAATFAPSGNMDVFLMPTLNFAGGWAQTNGTATYNDQHLNDFWILYPRGAFLDPLHPLYPLEKFTHGFNGNNAKHPPEGNLNNLPSSPYDSTGYSRALTITEWMKTLPGSRGIYRVSTSGLGGFTTTDDGSMFNSGVPATPTGDIFYYSTYFTPSNINLIYLRAVVLKGGTYYYFWNSGWA